MRFGSVCSGIEAASVAWGPLGWEAAWVSEIEPFPSAVLAHHYPSVPNLGDMTTLPDRILSAGVEAPDLFCGGTPCQAFSVAGLRRSLDDARGNLSLTFCEIADAIDHVRLAGGKPASIVFWENVPGVLNTADNAFGCFLGALAGCDSAIEPLAATGWTDAGVVAGPVRTVAWRVLDAQFFGLAQRRRRVFVVASARDGFDPAQVLLEFEGVRRDTAPSREAGKGVARGAAPSPAGGELVGTIGCNTGPRGHGFGDFLNNQAVDAGHLLAFGGGQNCAETDVSTALSAHPGGSRLDFQTETFVAVPVAVPDVAGTMKACKDSAGWSNSADHAAAGYMVPVAAVAMRESGQGYWMQDDIAGTIDANMGMSGHANRPAVIKQQAMQVRRLTPVECERLQGFPDHYTAIPWRGKPASECPDGPRYKALGNSWAVPVVRWIGRRIDAAL